MAASSCFDIDAGAAAACGSADISWSSLSRLESFPPTIGAIFGTTEPTYAQCATASMSGGYFDGTSIPLGTFICYKTSAGSYAYIKIEASGTPLGIKFNLWKLTE
ncbi:MAG: hypothetical protein IT326_04605 [Anaerolineae bacterium]|nr:hypothetical protein [Anaerolineae bacterium]